MHLKSGENLACTKQDPTLVDFLKRISNRNYWVESDWNGCKDVTYGRFVAHAICIGIIQG